MTGAILIIDDNASMREVLTDIFVSTTGAIFTAANGQEGLEILREQHPNVALVLLDMNMPVMNGEQTYAKMQEIAPEIKVIVLTSLNQAEVEFRFGHHKLPTYLQKPFDVDLLLNIVQTELANRRSPVLYPDPEFGYLQTREDEYEKSDDKRKPQASLIL